MSPLGQKPDITSPDSHVCYVPIADMKGHKGCRAFSYLNTHITKPDLASFDLSSGVRGEARRKPQEQAVGSTLYQ